LKPCDTSGTCGVVEWSSGQTTVVRADSTLIDEATVSGALERENPESIAIGNASIVGQKQPRHWIGSKKAALSEAAANR
jgi:hypothetical protein